MREPGPESVATLDSTLCEALSVLRCVAADIGAKTISVCLLEKGGSSRLLYRWPEIQLQSGSAVVQNGSHGCFHCFDGYVPVDSPVAGYLAAICQLRPSSFVLVSWGAHRHTGVIAFGFPPDAPAACIPADLSGVVQLAALASWCVNEIGRLRSELTVVSERLGGRKLVEQAKLRLQQDLGLKEPEAYAYLRKLSRQRRIRMAEIARDLLSASGSAPTNAPP